MGHFTIHASEFSPNRIIICIETTLELDADDLRSKLRRIGSAIRIINVTRNKDQWSVTIAHSEVNPHPLNARIWNLLEQAYARKEMV